MTVCCRCMYVIASHTRPECDCLLQVYVRYCEPYEAVLAMGQLCKRTFDGHSLILTYFPLDSFIANQLF